MNTNNIENTLLEELLGEKFEPIAIVGMSMRFPGEVNNSEAFKSMLLNARDGITEIPKDRWENDDYYSDVSGILGSINTHSGGYVRDIDKFDPSFFSISPKEANNIDPQQRMMLELTWEALEQGNIDPSKLKGSNGSVYVGLSSVDYTRELIGLAPEQLVNQMGTGTASSAVSGRVSYFLGLKGPCLSVDTACSSSLVAMHLAANGLRSKESDLAICAGVNIIHHPSNHIIFSHANMLSSDGRCKTFDETADGYGRSEGSAVLVLKRLSDAIRDKNTIMALMRGSSVSQDGESGGLTVPNGKAQETVMREAISRSMLTPSDINYVEAHGTGTPLGDPIEINSINSIFNQDYTNGDPIPVGSVKTNLGHMEATAGIGGVIKVILQMQESLIFPHINLTAPSPHIKWSELCVKVPTISEEWRNDKKRALVNSFGFAGTLASVVLESSEQFRNKSDSARNFKILTLSAKTPNALSKQVQQYFEHIKSLNESNLDLLCYSTNVGRSHFNYRFSLGSKSLSSLQSQLEEKLDLDSKKWSSSLVTSN
ncbi:type I polyketide synthase [Photorhabdus tasmaniensis]|uniref:type I polyketide synthase n=1 Tax=Photorhabdus tasmaniensis TaxID=1004159 RepID=UPI0040427B46